MRRDSRAAFTLIELLVVIAIIAILAAILFPTFSRLRVGVRQTECISNMHEIAQRMFAYRDDHGGEYPSMLLGYAERADGFPWQTGDPTPVEAKLIKHSSLYPAYINDITKFHCPISLNKIQTDLVAPTFVGPSLGYATPQFNTLANSKLGFPFPSLPPAFQGKPIAYYGYDSYDMSPIPGSPGSYEVTYTRDWTGSSGRTDASNQLKYGRSLSADKTVVTWCNIHNTVSKLDTSPVLLASGQAKVYNTAKVNQYGWTFATVP